METNFELKPFDRNTALESIEISGNVSRSDRNLKIEYCLAGDLDKVIVPPLDRGSDRLYDLWEHTCFEFFLRLKDTTKYWEFNLAPSGNWNVFCFYNYRENITEEMSFESLPFKVSQSPHFLELSVDVDLTKIAIAEDNLDIAISAVVENKARQLSYWALIHPAIEADFHHPDSFIIGL